MAFAFDFNVSVDDQDPLCRTVMLLLDVATRTDLGSSVTGALPHRRWQVPVPGTSRFPPFTLAIAEGEELRGDRLHVVRYGLLVALAAADPELEHHVPHLAADVAEVRPYFLKD